MKVLKDHYRLEFSSWREFIEYSASCPSECDRHSRTGDDDWCGDLTFDQAVSVGRYGWPDGVRDARPYVESLIDKVGATLERFELEYDVEGQLVDVARYLDGEPECMIRFNPVLVEGAGYRHLKVVVNMTFSAGIPAQDIINRGRAIAALIELLELSGHRCEVTVVHEISTYGGPKRWGASIMVKEFDDNLDLDRITYAVTHPSVLRRHLFSVQEAMPPNVRRSMGVPDGGYGQPADSPSEERGDIYVRCVSTSGYNGEFSTEAQSITWIKDHLKAQGVVLREEESHA